MGMDLKVHLRCVPWDLDRSVDSWICAWWEAKQAQTGPHFRPKSNSCCFSYWPSDSPSYFSPPPPQGNGKLCNFGLGAFLQWKPE